MKYPNAASTGTWLSSGGWKVSHPGLVVSEGSAVFSSLCAAGLTCEHRACRFDGCLRASCVAGGRAVDTLHISTARSEEEMKIDVEKWRGNPSPLRYIYYHLYKRDTFVRVFISIYTRARAGFKALHILTRECVCIGGGVIIDMWYNCIWSPNKQRISPSPWWRWQTWWTSALVARTTLDLLKIIDLLFVSQVGDK